jgi:uncharacterized protein DUF3467
MDYSGNMLSGWKERFHTSTEKECASMSEEIEQEQQQSDEITLRVNWHFPEGLQSRYGNNVLVQAGQSEFIISFFEMQLPILLGPPEENKAKLKEMGSIQAECVSKVIIPPRLVKGLIDALQTELDKFSSQGSNQE